MSTNGRAALYGAIRLPGIVATVVAIAAYATACAKSERTGSSSDSGASAQATAAGGTPLTPAELRLLPYLQTHLTIREIGERLFVSRNTVKTQAISIYQKLAVSSRSEAIERARECGLLGS